MSITNISKLFDSSFIGFDRLFRDMELYAEKGISVNFPPYNVSQTENGYIIEFALAGFKEDEIELSVLDNKLYLSAKKTTVESSNNFLYKGIATRDVNRSFTLAENIEVHEATFNDGILKVVLNKNIPDEKKPKTVKINSGKQLLEG